MSDRVFKIGPQNFTSHYANANDPIEDPDGLKVLSYTGKASPGTTAPSVDYIRVLVFDRDVLLIQAIVTGYQADTLIKLASPASDHRSPHLIFATLVRQLPSTDFVAWSRQCGTAYTRAKLRKLVQETHSAVVPGGV